MRPAPIYFPALRPGHGFQQPETRRLCRPDCGQHTGRDRLAAYSL